LSLEDTKYGWDRKHHTIFVDQPIGTGFSWSEDDRDRCYDEECVGNDMLDFLQAFFEARPDLQGRDFFVTGESYVIDVVVLKYTVLNAC
jgi:carboxypeptidase C (cathepsin A)